MRTLVTRPKEDAERTARNLTDAGHSVVVSPALRVEPTDARIPEDSFDLLIAASANAFAFLPSSTIERLRRLPIDVVGSRTAQAARELGFTQVRTIAATAESLVELMRGDLRAGLCALYLAGAQRKATIERGLASVGVDVAIVEIYRTVCAERLTEAALGALRAGTLDAVLHFSRRSAECFAALVHAEGLDSQIRELPHLCLSEDVAKGLASLRPACVQWPERPQAQDLIALLENPLS